MTKHLKSILRIALVLLGTHHGLGAAPPDSTLQFAVDYARFRINAVAAQVELYLGLPRAQLRFLPEGESLLASFESRVVISAGDSQIVTHNWVAHSFARDTAEISPSQILYTQAVFQLPVGNYRFSVHVRDLRSGYHGEKSFEVPVARFETENLALSDLEISARLMKDTTRSLFYKNHYTVIPHPHATYGLSLPMLYAYAEVYNLTFPGDSAYSVAYRILDGQGNALKTLPVKRRPIQGKQLVEVGAINVVSLPAGTFFLELRVRDHNTQTEAVQRRKFFVYREDQPPATALEGRDLAAGVLQALYRSRLSEDLDEEFKAARYLATKEEQKIYAALNAEAKQDFFVKFWQARDRSPETPINEFREDYLKRAKFANENFSGLRKGAETDMGRVLLIYGQPDEIERFPSTSENRPYQIWKYYQIEGGVEFVLVDASSWGEYKLVHATARGELRDDDWQRWINPAR